MTAEDVRSVTFEQVRKGYKPEDVDDFLLQVATDMQRLEAERDTAIAEKAAFAAEQNALLAERDNAVAAKEDAEAKMYVLAGKVEEYRGQEETLKTALINAQRMGETVVYEAKQKADGLLRDATNKSDMLRQSAEDDSERERKTLENLQNEVKNFKTTILNLYKQHIESLSALDPPVEKAEKALEEYPARTEPTASEEAINEAWIAQENVDLSIEISGPPVMEEEPVVTDPVPMYQPQPMDPAPVEPTAPYVDSPAPSYIEPASPTPEMPAYSQQQPVAPVPQATQPLQQPIVQPLQPVSPIQPLQPLQPLNGPDTTGNGYDYGSQQ